MYTHTDLAEAFAQFASTFVGLVWSTPTALLLTGAGVIFTLATLGVQWRALTHGLAVVRGKYDRPEDAGNISHFQALSAALSATIGLGNIAGVAVAVAAGGPGAVFWMWVVGLLGMATKFTTCSLATMYRREDSRGEYRGGPMYYIRLGLGQSKSGFVRGLGVVLGGLFAILGMIGCFGIGNMFQSNQVAKIYVNLGKAVSPEGLSTGTQYGVQIAVGVGLAVLAGLVIIGGIRRIGHVAGRLVPTMCVLYVAGALLIIVQNLEQVPGVFADIFTAAFSLTAGSGAFLGVAVREAAIQGIRRACFSNEAGLGSAPIAHATAKTNEPIREGVVAALGPFIDTVVICTMTALVILITGTLTRPPCGVVDEFHYGIGRTAAQTLSASVRLHEPGSVQVGDAIILKQPTDREGLYQPIRFDVSSASDDGGTVTITRRFWNPDPDEAAAWDYARKTLADDPELYLHREGINLTAMAFDNGLAGFGTYFIPIAALLFAFSTMISWGFYGETCATYLFGDVAVLPFKIVYVCMIVVGALFMNLGPVLDFADGLIGLMLVPNLIGTLLLLPVVMRAARDYFGRLSAGRMTPTAADATDEAS